MKLRNKKTGVIVDLVQGYIKDSYYGQKIEIKPLAISNKEGYMYNSLAELNEDWEDYEEQKVGYIIDPMEEDYMSADDSGYEESDVERAKELGIWLETKEEAEKAVEKLKIYNKLKQKGFVFSGWYYSTEGQLVILADNHEFSETEPEDLTELFGDKIC